MEHGRYLVDLVDEHGNVIDKKPRKDVDKKVDVYHSVHILLVTPRGELVLGKIPARKDFPNLYSNQLGVTVATIKRSNESADRAAVRAISRELFIDDARIYHVGDKFHHLPDGHRTYLSAYYLVGNPPATFSATDINGLTTLTTREFRERLLDAPQDIAPTFIAFWETYYQQLPV